MKNFHEKPRPRQRSVKQALEHAEEQRRDLPIIVQVHASDWDLVILADEVNRLREFEWMYKDLCK